jgi:glycosyltransferase involved in cell wall biosynthesis
MPKTVLVVPCYNEEARLDVGQFTAFAKSGAMGLLFVDDGSRDRTKDVLAKIAAAAPEGAAFLVLPANGGKAEAVRAGMRHALAGGAAITGYFDADMATPLDEMVRLEALMDSVGAEAALCSRIRMLGSAVERKTMRHYLGRLFATLASMTLRLPVYDTQCGAKLFQRSARLDHALATPFKSRWAFDVELLGRLALPPEQMVEMPVRVWRDVAGSKMSLKSTLRMGTDLAKIWRELRRVPLRGTENRK